MNRPNRSLPWSRDEYHKLEPGDLEPEPAPTPEQRLRVVAAIATFIRDAGMTGLNPVMNAETIRSVLVMDEGAWARDIPELKKVGLTSYDDADPRLRFEQVQRAFHR